MMKKLSKLALLAAAAAFLVAALPACSSGSGGEGDTAQGSGSGTGGSGTGGGGSGSGSGGGSGSSSVNAVWDFNVASLTAVGLSTTSGIQNPTTDNIAPKSGSGATLKFKSSSLGKSVKIQNADTGGLNIGSGSTESDILVITVDAACTLSFTGKGSTGATWSSNGNGNSFSVKDTNVYTRKSAEETSSQTWKYKCDTAGEYTIKAGGMIFTELKCE